MNFFIHAPAIVAVLGVGVVFGTDAFCVIALRPALVHLDDRALVKVAGHLHIYADRRMPIPGAIGAVAALVAAVAAILSRSATPAVAAGVAVACLVGWLVLYLRVAAPVNREFARAALADQTPTNARALQQSWESVIVARVGLQAAALLALCITLIAA